MSIQRQVTRNVREEKHGYRGKKVSTKGEAFRRELELSNAEGGSYLHATKGYRRVSPKREKLYAGR